MLQKAIEERFMRSRHGEIWTVVNTPQMALERYIVCLFGILLFGNLRPYEREGYNNYPIAG